MVIYKDDNQEENVIYIDSRERDRGKRFKKVLNSKINNGYLERDENKTIVNSVEITALDVGDIVYNECIFEYKTLNDAINSMNDGFRIFQQCIDMDKQYEYPYLVVVGNKQEIIENKPPWTYKMYESGLNNIGNAMPILQPLTEEQAFDSIIKTIVEHKTGHGMTRKYMNKSFNPVLNTVHTATKLSWNQSKDLIRKFNISTIADLLKLTPEDFKTIKGVKDKKTKNVMLRLHGMSYLEKFN